MVRRIETTVIIPCFNRAQRIEAAIGSALSQTSRPIEVLVVDDGSTDSSAAVAAAFGSPVRVIRTENRGPSAARNLGIAEARGSWIAFLDTDDYWLPEKLELQSAALDRFPQVGLVYCDTETWHRGQRQLASRFSLGGVYEACVAQLDEYLLFDRSLFQHLLGESRIFTSTVLVRRDLPGLCFPEHLRQAEDWAVWLELVRSVPFAAVDRTLVRMHYDGDNLSSDLAAVLRSGLPVLERLLTQPDLTHSERRAVELALDDRHVGALYHSLAGGDTEAARTLLEQPRSRSLGRIRRLIYRLLATLPSSWVEWLGRVRSAGRHASR